MLALTEPALQTFAMLLLAHAVADFSLQPDWMVARKKEPAIFLLHILIVFVLSVIALGGALELALFVAGSHLVIDAVKNWALSAKLSATAAAFITDQCAHMLVIVAVSLWMPQVVGSGIWQPWLPQIAAVAAVLSGFILTVYAGGYFVGMITNPFAAHVDTEGLLNAGRMIGQLERALIFFFIMADQPTGVGFLIAAKSLLRFESARKQNASEYVIIGTLTSVGWALVMSVATLALLNYAPAPVTP
ncbi:MAG: DUF3307 domain-containing protein [Pseudomonadota bacterium]